MGSLVKSLARLALFGPRKRPMTTRERIQAKAEQLRKELAAKADKSADAKLREVETHILAFRAVERAVKP